MNSDSGKKVNINNQFDINPKYIVIDEEITENQGREKFLNNLNLPAEHGLFVNSYESALKAIKANLNIVLCFIRLQIFTASGQLNWELVADSEEWKLELISYLSQGKFYVYSYLDSEQINLQEIEPETDNTIVVPDSERSQIEHLFATLLSSQKPEKSQFDYSSLDRDKASRLWQKTQELRRSGRKIAQEIINSGKILLEAKEIIKYGEYQKWVRAEFWGSEQTARRCKQAAKIFGHIDMSGLDIAATAIYKLVGSDVPTQAIEEVLERAKKGERITKNTTLNIIEEHHLLEQKTNNDPDDFIDISPINSEQKSITSPKNEILTVIPSDDKVVKNTWWQLGQNKLFCGQPQSDKFRTKLPQNIALTINFLPENNYSLISPIESIFTFTFNSKYDDLELGALVKECVRTGTKPHEIIVFNYIYYPELLEIPSEFDCLFWAAEPDLEKCARILAIWRKKGSVSKVR